MKTITLTQLEVENIKDLLEVQLEILVDTIPEEELITYEKDQLITLVELLRQLEWEPNTTVLKRGIQLYDQLKGGTNEDLH